jgi:ribosomal protein S12 methylthiotransferase
MNEIATAVTESSPISAPKVGFVSLGCPKALTDSELILTQLSAEGYQTSKTFEGADLVIVNTCGFIDDAVKESLDTISEALNVSHWTPRSRLRLVTTNAISVRRWP